MRGEKLPKYERPYAEKFAALLAAGLLRDDPRPFLRKLIDCANPRKLRLLDAILAEANHYHDTEQRVRKAVEAKYPGKWKESAWRKAWKEFWGYP
jgi:hypothetical protein